MAEPALPLGEVYGRKTEKVGAQLHPSYRRWWVSSPPGLGFLKQAVCWEGKQDVVGVEAILVHTPLTQCDHCYRTQSLTQVSTCLIKGETS